MRNIAYKEMFENEMTHAWYVGTRNLMIQMLKKYLKMDARILDAGCGTGGTIIYLRKVGYKNVAGIDRSKGAINYCLKRGLKNIKMASVNHLPFDDASFDSIICLDVLYHEGVDLKAAMSEFRRVLKKGGILYLQEPAFNWLRGSHDQIIQTKHRFTKGELKKLVEESGFKIIKSSYFNSVLFVPIAIKRILEKVLGVRSKSSDVGKLHPTVNNLMKLILKLERKIVEAGFLPFGLSTICFAQKTS